MTEYDANVIVRRVKRCRDCRAALPANSLLHCKKCLATDPTLVMLTAFYYARVVERESNP